MIEHLFMLRCILFQDEVPLEGIFINAQAIHRNGNDWVYIDAITWLINHQLPREAESLKDNPYMIQCEQCQGIFPEGFIHLTMIPCPDCGFPEWWDLCEACWKGLGR